MHFDTTSMLYSKCTHKTLQADHLIKHINLGKCKDASVQRRSG